MTAVVSRTTSLTEAKPPKQSIQKLPYFLINAFIIIFTLADRNRQLLLNQYLYNRLARDVLGNVTIDTTSQPCVNESDPGTSDSDADRVQSMTSSMIMKFDITGSVLAVFAVLYLGTFSTSLGRRAQLLIPISGYTVRALSILAVAFWDLDISWLYVGCVAEGLAGGIAGVYLGAYLYVSDITPRNRKRTLGMALLEGIRGIMGSGINVASGQMIQRTTFLVPALFTTCGALACLLMACVMPNHMQASEKWSMHLVKRSYRTLISPLSKSKDHRVRRMVLVAAAVYFFGFSTIYGLDRVRLLYLMHRPFCMSAITIGWYQFGRQALFNMTIITLVPLLHRCFPGVSLAILGALASTAEYTLYAFAQNDVHLYIALALAFGQGLPLNLIRGETSRLFGTEEQGPLFACMAVLESISFAVGIFMMSIYTLSLGFYAGLSFLVFAAMTAIVMLFLCIFQYLWKDYNDSLLQSEKASRSQGVTNQSASLSTSDPDSLVSHTQGSSEHSAGKQPGDNDENLGGGGGGRGGTSDDMKMVELNREHDPHQGSQNQSEVVTESEHKVSTSQISNL
ncbi:solute carrier family 46 member 3-like [Plakobranchus ocellatus]|uniref:Solute carrier family 46 member 3-like n=1 Tax=Plakobranchus ocellatus TaxID=259542 RepID=A0AAV4CSQ0_9GAST|nr:solute carrier family 46 member 3-like [Plakobranchus ocellatus]